MRDSKRARHLRGDAAGKLQKHDGVILRAHVYDSAVTKETAHPHDVAKQPAQRVHRMHRLRHQHATSSARRGQPGLDSWRCFETSRLGEKHFPDAILLHDFAHLFNSLAKYPVVHRKEFSPGASGGSQHPVTLDQRWREWLFAHDVLASLERLDCVLFVDVVGQQHADTLHIWIVQHFVPTCEHSLHTGCFGPLARELHVQVVDANHVRSASGRERL